MKQIYKWAIFQLGFGNKVMDAISMLDNNEAERFVEVLTDFHIKEDELPQEFYHKNKLVKLVSYNYVRDIVTYRQDDTSTRWFSNPEDAKLYSNNGEYNWNNSASQQTENYTIKADWTRECEHTTSYYEWMNWYEKR